MSLIVTREQEIGRLAWREFFKSVGIDPTERQNRPEKPITSITKELEQLETFGMRPSRVALLQRAILQFASVVQYLHYDLNNDKRALQAKIASSGHSPEIFREFCAQSRKYVAIRDFSDDAVQFIDRMNESLFAAIESTLDELRVDNATTSNCEGLMEYLELYTDFNTQVILLLDGHLHEVAHRSLHGEHTNYLTYCRQDLQVRLNDFCASYKEDHEHLITKLQDRIQRMLFVVKMSNLIMRWRPVMEQARAAGDSV